jgi:hypothetical protein
MKKGNYVDGFVLVIPKKNIAAYKKMAAEASKVWRKFGALDYKECMGEDLKPNMGGAKSLTFTKMTNAKPGIPSGFPILCTKTKSTATQSIRTSWRISAKSIRESTSKCLST